MSPAWKRTSPMRVKQLQVLLAVLLLAASVLALWKLESPIANTPKKLARNPPTPTKSGKGNFAKSSDSNKAQNGFVTPFTVERLSVEHDLTPTQEEWQELTRTLLQADDGDLVTEVKARFSVHAGSKELVALVTAYENPENDDVHQRIVDIFSTLHSADFPETARKILNDENRPITDDLVCASALSLVRLGEQQDILAIFRRLNSAGEDPLPEGSLYSDTDGLIGAMIEARDPSLEILLVDAAAGRGAATTGQARMAAAAALANYHTIPVTEVLYNLSKNEPNAQVRKQAERSLKAIQTNE